MGQMGDFLVELPTAGAAMSGTTSTGMTSYTQERATATRSI